ncbi:uncharacterized protein F5891DRAFT_1199302 [Suillus fuscotomentosus]|uniref:Uncharacterized protein n=1 Tax=Suillus fuscotomentosus TaxID=1912939 RepID=A0AAD4DPM7_9AGAM|nr:uncharacterized protein F5891DRAFT_1199302 [Suillus fuscotomentosus]KAG1888443.1 hypothetical protein F5891DRAFT_1199302 [Suillus fuscotomentosus]
MSLSQFNARLQYKKNQTGTYIKTFLGHRQRKYLRGKARELDSNGGERKQRRAQVEYDRKLIEKNHEIDKRRKEWRDAATAKLNAIVPCLVDADLAKMRVADIVLQLRWHHEFDLHVPRNKDMPKRKEDKLKVLREAIARYTSGEVTHRETTQEVPLETGESEDEDKP